MIRLAACALALAGCGPLATSTPTSHEVIVEWGATVPDLTPPDTLTLSFPTFDGYDDATVRQLAADAGCGPIEIRDHVAHAPHCDY